MIAHSGDKLLDRASICSTGTASGNIRMAVAFSFLGAKIYQRQEGQLNGEGEVQTGSLEEILPIQRGRLACFDRRSRGQAKGHPVPHRGFRC